MESPVGPPKYKVGDRVIYTNDYGVCWGVKTVTEVLDPDKWSNRYHIEPTDAPWMYVREKNLAPAPEANPAFGTW